MPYAPSVQDRSGEIRLAGMQALGQGVGQFAEGIAKGYQQYQQNKLMTSQATGKFEGAIRANPELLQFLDPENPNPAAPPEAVKAFSKLRKDGTLALKDAALLSTFTDSYTKTKEEAQMAKLREMQMAEIKRKAEQQATDEKAMSSAIAPFTPGGAMDAAIRGGARFEQLPQQGAQFDPAKFMGEYFRQGGSPASLDKVDTYMKMMAPAAQPKAPEGYMWTQGGLTFIPGGPADPANPKNREAQPFQSGSVMSDSSGKYIGNAVFDQRTGKMMLATPDGQHVPIPTGARPSTPTAQNRGVPDWKEFKQLRTDLVADERSLRDFSRYMSGVKNVSDGLDVMADQIQRGIKTLLGQGLTEKEIEQAATNGRLEGLLGSTRLSTLGPGPVTEQDAIRLINRMGGKVGPLTNKAVVKRLLGEMYADKYENYTNNLNMYNEAVNSFYGQYPSYKPAKAIEFNPDFVDAKHFSELQSPKPVMWDSDKEKRMRELEARAKGTKGK